jgi:L,D-peptidoglycan transpeptidase YkuD (ErfK/YbiS/YcfS/YnhG family)
MMKPHHQGIKKISRLPGFLLGAAALLCFLSATAATGGEKPALQALVVTTADWSAVDAILRLYQRKDIQSAWMPAGEGMSAVVGRNGLAWGRGIRDDLPDGGPQKQEGDGRAPAGIFPLGPAFGYAPVESVPWIGLPYRQMTEKSKCVDDPASAAYNRLIEGGSVRQDWNSAEDMRRSDEQYRLGIVIGHNADPAAPGGGSCNFLHIWERPSRGTSGCTAVSAADMEEILRRLRPEANPLLIQLPQQEYGRLRGPRGLP